jgi:UDP-N-acetylglucosamine--dolichyl-phosphate N-acetylglucosaminephosphotransferase
MADSKVRRRSNKPTPPYQQDPAAGIDDDDARSAPVLTIKWSKLTVLTFLALSPYLLLLYFLPVDPGLMRSILTNLAMSVAGFVGVILLIPVASKYVLRRNMFGYDINKRGSAGGKVKV